jgi:CheY-like chemotaxis protein
MESVARRPSYKPLSRMYLLLEGRWVQRHQRKQCQSRIKDSLEAAAPAFDLVSTDVVMPETDGRALGRIIGERYPGLPELYVSAYPSDDVFHRGAPNPLVPFLQQPFSPDAVLMLVSATADHVCLS